MRVLKAHVRGGRLELDEPLDLPEGTEIRVALVEDDLDDDERAALEASLEESERELDAGLGMSLEEFWAQFRANRRVAPTRTF
jgi:hypothetical protein